MAPLSAAVATELEPAQAGKKPRPRKKRGRPAFKFEFFQTPAPGTAAREIVDRWESGDINRQQANNLLMLAFQHNGDVEAYSALYQLNSKHFTNIINRRLNGFARQVSPSDVLQDVFLLIYRYSRNFKPIHDRSFYNWSYSIIINTIRRKIRKLGVKTVDLETISNTHADTARCGPVRNAIISEDIERLKRLYTLTLMLYLNVYRDRLTGREQAALHHIEALGLSYQDAAEAMGLKYDNFKMVVCRARRKILEGITALVNKAAFLGSGHTLSACN